MSNEPSPAPTSAPTTAPASLPVSTNSEQTASVNAMGDTAAAGDSSTASVAKEKQKYTVLNSVVFDPTRYGDSGETNRAALNHLGDMSRLLDTQYSNFGTDTEKIAFCIDHLQSIARESASKKHQHGYLVTLADFNVWFRESFITADDEDSKSVWERVLKIPVNSDLTKVCQEFGLCYDLNDMCKEKISDFFFREQFLKYVKNNNWMPSLRNTKSFRELLSQAKAFYAASRSAQAFSTNHDPGEVKATTQGHKFNGPPNKVGKPGQDSKNFGRRNSSRRPRDSNTHHSNLGNENQGRNKSRVDLRSMAPVFNPESGKWALELSPDEVEEDDADSKD